MSACIGVYIIAVEPGGSKFDSAIFPVGHEMDGIQILPVGQRLADLFHAVAVGFQHDHLKRTIVIGVGHDIVNQLCVILDTGIDKNEFLGPDRRSRRCRISRRCAVVSLFLRLHPPEMHSARVRWPANRHAR